MAPNKSKQSDRRAGKTAAPDDEVAAGAGSAGVMAAAKELALGSVLAEVMLLPKLLKASSTAKEEVKEEVKEESKDENAENKEESETVKTEETPKDLDSLFESLEKRLPFSGSLGLDKAPEEEWLMFARLEIDFGPFKRKKGNAALERILVNVERNLSQYMTIALALMCMNALVFRSYFACLPWLVGYQLLSLNLPMDLIRENFPQLPPIDVKARVGTTMAIHALVWFFFVLELLCKTYFLAKFPLIALFAVHAFVAAPEVNVEAARKALGEKKAAEAGEVKPQEPGTVNAKTLVSMIKLNIMDSFLVKVASMGPELVKELKEATSKTAEKKSDDADEKKTRDEPKEVSSAFETLLASLSIFNVLGLGVPCTVESFKNLMHQERDFGPKKGSSIKERFMANFEQNMAQYIHVFLVLMCIRSFLFRSFFACLPWCVAYQMVCCSMPLIRSKISQVPPLDVVFQVAAAATFHALVWFFFVYEATVQTHMMEKCMLLGLIGAHAYVVVPAK